MELELPDLPFFPHILLGNDPQESDSQILENAYKFLDSGISMAKIKLGRRTPHQEKKLISAIANLFLEKKIKAPFLRFDGNRRLISADLHTIIENIDPHWINYIEEPFVFNNEMNEWIEFQKLTGIGLALDEILVQEWALSIAQEKWPVIPQEWAVKALIIKPPLLGGFMAAIKVMNWAHQQNLMGIISNVSHDPKETWECKLLSLMQNRKVFTPSGIFAP